MENFLVNEPFDPIYLDYGEISFMTHFIASEFTLLYLKS